MTLHINYRKTIIFIPLSSLMAGTGIISMLLLVLGFIGLISSKLFTKAIEFKGYNNQTI